MLNVRNKRAGIENYDNLTRACSEGKDKMIPINRAKLLCRASLRKSLLAPQSQKRCPDLNNSAQIAVMTRIFDGHRLTWPYILSAICGENGRFCYLSTLSAKVTSACRKLGRTSMNSGGNFPVWHK